MTWHVEHLKHLMLRASVESSAFWPAALAVQQQQAPSHLPKQVFCGVSV